jgi:hypothetical protein
MAKKIIWPILLAITVTYADGNTLDDVCLQCHRKNRVPDTIIYRRYLQTYGTPDRMVAAMQAYIRNPNKSRSIMPPQFFYKFPMKPNRTYEPETLERFIRAYIERFDVRKRLRLKRVGS